MMNKYVELRSSAQFMVTQKSNKSILYIVKYKIIHVIEISTW